MTDERILQLLMISAAQAMDRHKQLDDVTKGRIGIEFLNGVLQSTAFCMSQDGEVSPHRLNKVAAAGMKAIGLTIS